MNSTGTQPYIHAYPFSLKLASLLGCRLTLSRAPCAMQQVLVGHPSQREPCVPVHRQLPNSPFSPPRPPQPQFIPWVCASLGFLLRPRRFFPEPAFRGATRSVSASACSASLSAALWARLRHGRDSALSVAGWCSAVYVHHVSSDSSVRGHLGVSPSCLL